MRLDPRKERFLSRHRRHGFSCRQKPPVDNDYLAVWYALTAYVITFSLLFLVTSVWWGRKLVPNSWHGRLDTIFRSKFKRELVGILAALVTILSTERGRWVILVYILNEC
ncbi:hypothetical protein GGR57DRAFT_509241 [Xylariaceae sp. FL1272]|nr:hypothetical protein GGR57DRAFT_509241 [Xylariaceae sp. FL1272]